MTLRAATILTAMLWKGLVVAQAQLHPIVPEDRGGGTHQGCNPSLVVAFTDNVLGDLDYRFDPVVTVGNNQLYGNIWSYLTDDFAQSTMDSLFLTYPNAGQFPVCLTVNAFDLEEQQPCSTTTCRLIDIVPDSICLEMVADFTIGNLSGQSVTFENLSSFPDSLLQFAWDFGDSGFSMEDTPSYDFVGNGPHKICLVVVGPPPLFCSTSVCKWLYFGPGDVDCDLLLDPGFLLVQQEALVGVLDTSITSGMESSVAWDFGDGTQAEGRIAVHAYQDAGFFELCSTISTWGPLLSDTCHRTHCVWVNTFNAVGIEQLVAHTEPIAWPVPFTERITLAGLEKGLATVWVIDIMGREVYLREHLVGGPTELDLGHLLSGMYILQSTQHGRRHALRIVKD